MSADLEGKHESFLRPVNPRDSYISNNQLTSPSSLLSTFKSNVDKETTAVTSSSGPADNIQVQLSGPGSTVQTRTMEEEVVVYDKLNDTNYIPDDFRMTLTPWINRPYLIANIPWSTTDARYSVLNNSATIRSLPRDAFLNSNINLRNALAMAALLKCKMCINVSISGTISHQGTLVVSITPPSTTTNVVTDNGRIINTLLSCPHAFLSANSANSVCLELPWFSNTDYASLGLDDSSYAYTHINMALSRLIIMVLNPLLVNGGASNNIVIILEAFFKELDITVPVPRVVTFTTSPPTSILVGESALLKAGSKFVDGVFNSAKVVTGDAIDLARSYFKYHTGFHNPNIATLQDKKIMSLRNYMNTVDSANCYEKLDPYTTVDRIDSEPVFGTFLDEMSLKYIISKPQYLGTFQVLTSSGAGSLCWARPISPYQGGCAGGVGFANNIELLYNMTRAHKGTLKIHIQSSMTNKHAIKLKVFKYYNPDIRIATQFPTYTSLLNCPSDLLEFSSGGQTLTVDLPFLCENRLALNSRNLTALAQTIGMYYIFVAHPLVLGDSITTAAEFNVYMSCADDFQFYGYSTEVVRPVRSVALGLEETENDFGPILEYESKASEEEEDDIPLLSGESEVMNAPSSQSVLRSYGFSDNQIDASRLVPLTDIRPLIRRNQFFINDTFTTVSLPGSAYASFEFTLPISVLMGERYDSFFRGSTFNLPHMYYGKQCGMKFKARTLGTATLSVSYAPPNISVDPASGSAITNRTFLRASPATGLPGAWQDVPSIPATGDIRGIFPLPTIEAPVSWHPVANNSDDGPEGIFEFAIPNVSHLKFVGGPSKNSTDIDAIVNPPYSSADAGSLIFRFLTEGARSVSFALYASFSDEARFGFHTKAPICLYPTTSVPPSPALRRITPYSDLISNLPAQPLITPPVSLYFSNLNTGF